MNADKSAPSAMPPGNAALTVDDARNAILDLVSTTSETERVDLIQCVNRVSAEDVFARQPIPPFRNSAMDGYAIRFDDLATSNQLNVVGQSLAGHPFNGPMTAGTAVTITTGAKIPDDADTIVIMENTSITDGKLILNQQPKKHQHVRNPGDDIAIDDKIVRRFQRLKPSDCGLIAAQGIRTVKVNRLPRVGVFSTGDELCESGDGQNGELVFWKVAMKPGKPMVTARLNSGTLFFGLPGNPVSSLVTCVQFVIPALQAFSGEKYTPPLSVEAICTTELKKEKGRFEFQRGWLSFNQQKLTVTTTGLQDSHVLSSVSHANCFICLPQDSSGAAIGEVVMVVPFDSLPGL